MNKNITKRNFGKFAKKNTHKRRGKDAARRELERLVASCGEDPKTARLKNVTVSGKSPLSYGDSESELGVFSSTKNAYGFVRLESGEDIFIPAGRTNHALDGDLVEIEYSRYKNRFGNEKTEGRVKKIVEYGRKTLIGALTEELVLFGRRRRGYVLVFTPDDPKIQIRPRVEAVLDAVPGDKVEVKLNRGGDTVTADVVRTFGDAESFCANYEAHLAEHGIEVDFSEAALAEAERVAGESLSCEGRVDRRDQIIFTVDGEGAKDLDDAISLRRLGSGGWQLGVHIADVSHYVRERTALDRAAMSRGTSVYFTDKVVPMLPTVISNGVCSLNADEDKYTLSAIVNIAPDGTLSGVKIEPSVIRSRVRGVYSEVNRIFDGTADSAIKAKYKSVKPTLVKMRELYEILKLRSRSRGALELDSSEASVLLDGKGEPCEIIKRERGVAEMMIEQFMLAANESVARLLRERGIPCVYRIHEPPPEDKLSDLLTYAKNLGLDISGMNEPSPRALSRLLSEAEEKGLFTPLSYTMLRSMSKARYSEEHHAHFGLGIADYCHFTSPIRRLADLATHRIIHRVLIEGKDASKYSSYARRAAVAASEAELRAVGAERDIENMYKALYMSRFVGKEFSSVVNSVTSFGLFCELENTCEGLVPISDMDGIFTFDEKTLTLRSATERYRLADRLTVRLEEVDVMAGKLRFSIVEREDAGK